FDDLGIELASGPDLDFFFRDGKRSAGTIRAIGTDRVERVGDGKDARTQWNLLAFQAARIPGAIKFLLVGVDNLGGLLQERNALEHVVAVERVLLHHSNLLGCE